MASRFSKRFTGVFSRTKSSDSQTREISHEGSNFEGASVDSPENNVSRSIQLFCESGSASNGGDEVLHLPAIVEAAESSPTAAAAAAQQIRKFMSREWASKPHVQYNAIMVIRILSDNPGPSFTRNFDKAFVSTIKEALRMCKDNSTQQILRETLDTLEANKQYQEGMDGLIAMWRKEKGQNASFGNPGSRNMGPHGANSNYIYSHPTMNLDRPDLDRRNSPRRGRLPAPVELASRIEEARNTAKILMQLLQTTPQEEVLHNELLREFSDRCSSAQKSMAGYIGCDNPPPDDETMLTLIETNEQLSLATSRYQRSVLNARKAMGVNSPGSEAMLNGAGPVATSAMPAADLEQNLFGAASPPPMSLPQQASSTRDLGATDEDFRPPPGPPPKQSALPTTVPFDDEQFTAPSGPPPRQSAQRSAFSNSSSDYSAPYEPPRRQWTQTSPTAQGANASLLPRTNDVASSLPPQRMSPQHLASRDPYGSSGSYSPPPSPPTTMLARLNSREGQNSPKPFEPKVEVSDPFADPIEHDASSAPFVSVTQSSAGNSDPSYAPGNITKKAYDADDMYDTSPVQSRNGQIPEDAVSPVSSSSQSRWQALRNAASSSGRTPDPANELTIRGAQPTQDIAEIDGHSEVGRTT